jgi:sugar phosphate permease
METHVLGKVTRRLIPYLFILYVVAFLDRVNLGYAALKMNADLSLSDAVFGLAAGIFSSATLSSRCRATFSFTAWGRGSGLPASLSAGASSPC